MPDPNNSMRSRLFDQDVDDDLKRELAFYDIALAGVRDCQEMCRSSGTPYQRPPDYYAEMVKTDDHMLKVDKPINKMFEGS
jgi:hypothetical protein